MKVSRAHSFDVSPKEAREIQYRLRKEIILRNDPALLSVKKIAGADVSYAKETNRIFATVVVLSWPSLQVIEEKQTTLGATFPYIPGLLVFREGEALLQAFEQIANTPELIMFDGQGLAHPRGIGIATHLGILLNVCSIGVAKTVLVGKYTEPAAKRGSFSSLFSQEGLEIGKALRTKNNVEPVFVSVGHRIDLETAVEFVLGASCGYRLPEPIRVAHLASNRLRLEDQSQQNQQKTSPSCFKSS